MPLLRRHGLLALLAVVVLVGGADATAHAASGRPLLVGKVNATGVVTIWARSTDGPVVGFRPQPGSPPFTTTSGARVVDLDADQVDGHDASTLLTTGYHYRVPAAPEADATLVDLPGLPPGLYQATYSVIARTPGGTMNCGFTMTGAHGRLEGLSFGSRRYSWSTANGSTILDTRRLHAQLLCFVNPSSQHAGLRIEPDAGALSSITLTRIDTLHTDAAASSAAPARGPARPTTVPTRRSNRCLNCGAAND